MRPTSAEIDLPLTAFEVTRLHSTSEVFGFFLPARPSGDASIVDGVDGRLFVIPLEGPRAFKRYLLQSSGPLEGLLFADIKFAVNVMSRANPNSEGQLGDLTLIDGKIHITTIDARDNWGDLKPFPLQSALDLKADVRARFQQWSLVIEHRQSEIEVWRTVLSSE